ncbi:MAP/microtubule affinity-regulating kinase 4-like [Crotalus adamanteus]|uniref:non-specific serine/threonine protein kinase n=1 Tax=Crotalus adamanteus TaxID=8729 RepID=A0AAW1AWD5_CROAD
MASQAPPPQAWAQLLPPQRCLAEGGCVPWRPSWERRGRLWATPCPDRAVQGRKPEEPLGGLCEAVRGEREPDPENQLEGASPLHILGSASSPPPKRLQPQRQDQPPPTNLSCSLPTPLSLWLLSVFRVTLDPSKRQNSNRWEPGPRCPLPPGGSKQGRLRARPAQSLPVITPKPLAQVEAEQQASSCMGEAQPAPYPQPGADSGTVCGPGKPLFVVLNGRSQAARVPLAASRGFWTWRLTVEGEFPRMKPGSQTNLRESGDLRSQARPGSPSSGLRGICRLRPLSRLLLLLARSCNLPWHQKEAEPRLLRFTWNVKLTSTRSAEAILAALCQATDSANCCRRQTEPFVLSCTHGKSASEHFCCFEVEVCRLQRLGGLHGVLFRRQAGTSLAFRSLGPDSPWVNLCCQGDPQLLPWKAPASLSVVLGGGRGGQEGGERKGREGRWPLL